MSALAQESGYKWTSCKAMESKMPGLGLFLIKISSFGSESLPLPS